MLYKLRRVMLASDSLLVKQGNNMERNIQTNYLHAHRPHRVAEQKQKIANSRPITAALTAALLAMTSEADAESGCRTHPTPNGGYSSTGSSC